MYPLFLLKFTINLMVMNREPRFCEWQAGHLDYEKVQSLPITSSEMWTAGWRAHVSTREGKFSEAMTLQCFNLITSKEPPPPPEDKHDKVSYRTRCAASFAHLKCRVYFGPLHSKTPTRIHPLRVYLSTLSLVRYLPRPPIL